MNDSDEKSAASFRLVDAVTAVVIFILGLVVIMDSRRLGSGWSSDGPQAGYFPFYIGLILCVASVINFINAIRHKSAEKDASFVSASSLKMVLSVLLPTILYVILIGGIGPIPGLGIYVASTIFIALFMVWLGKYKWPLALSVGVSVPIVFFLMFEIWFQVPLPKGPLEAMLGLD